MKKIGIMTFHAACNYGALLQTYALFNKLKSIYNDYEIEIIDYYCKDIEKRTKPFYFHKTGNIIRDFLRFFWQFLPRLIKYYKFKIFRNKYLKISSKKYSKFTLDEMMNDYDIIIVGSDQVWNLNTTSDIGYFLNTSNNKIIKASYAASFGFNDSFEDNKDIIISYLKDFKFISLRENIGFKELNTELKNKNIFIHVDPTLLLEKKEWDCIVPKRKNKKKFILVYCILESNNLLNYVEKYAEEHRLTIFSIGNDLKHKRYKQLKNLSIEEFIWYIKNAEIVFTTSFHGCVFSLIYNKRFVVELDTKNKYNSRVDYLLKVLKINNCNIESKKFTFNNYVDWDEVNKELLDERNKSITYLENISK